MNELDGIFRKGEITDYVSNFVPWEWTPDRDDEFFDNLIYSLFEDQEMFEWFKRHLGSLVVGGNKEELFYFWDGSGRNGKGLMDTLLKYSLGQFYTGFDVSYFTKYKKDSNAPEPEVVRLENKKLVMINELGETVRLITDKVKRISGNDTLSARTLYSNEVKDIECSFKCVIQTNHLPNFTDVDNGLLDRICPINFPFRFVSESVFDPEDPQHRKANQDLKTICKEKRVQFFNYLMRNCVPAYKAKGLYPLPKKVQANINIYRAKIDDVSCFVENELTPAEEGVITPTGMFRHYMAWRTQVVETEIPASRDKFAKRLKQLLGEKAYKRTYCEGKRQRVICGYTFANEYNYYDDI